MEPAEAVLLRRGWLSHLPAGLQKQVLSRSSLKTFEAGEALYHAGDQAGGMYGLVSGAAAISVAPGDYGPYFVHFALPGTWFGHASAIIRQPRRVGVMARRQTTVMYYPATAMDELVAANPESWRYFTLNVILSLDLAMQAYDDMMIRDPQTRVCAVLLRLAGLGADSLDGTGNGGARPTSNGDIIQIEVTQSEIAEISNLSRNGVGRILARLASAGLVESGYGHLRILKPRALIEQVANR